MNFKYFFMNRLHILATFAIVVFVAAGCGASSNEEKGEKTDKKVQLQKLKDEQTKLAEEIRKLEQELGASSPATEGRAKLVGVTTLAKQDFNHYIDLQGRIATDDIYFVTPRGMGGQVTGIYVKEGQPVKKGQLVLKTDDAILRQQLDQAKI